MRDQRNSVSILQGKEEGNNTIEQILQFPLQDLYPALLQKKSKQDDSKCHQWRSPT